MIKYFTIILFISLITNCTKKIDYQKTIQVIEANENLFELNYGLRGKANIFYSDSIHYFYFKEDTIEYLKVFKSKVLNDYKDSIKNYNHFPAKVSFYKYDNSYSIKILYIEDSIIKTDSLPINFNSDLAELFTLSKKKSDFYKKNQITGYYFNKKLETKTYSLLNYNKLFYTKNSENKTSYEFQNEYKISQKLKDNWYLLERIK
ncbi:hypothetical protein [Empedobacter brevis]|uniref:hypothetical protein n=1 Tax=Empedobacter brevis TaxID=247 RepID=UPI00289A928C|nr:hypothetical protein [Empedobacter brevis]